MHRINNKIYHIHIIIYKIEALYYSLKNFSVILKAALLFKIKSIVKPILNTKVALKKDNFRLLNNQTLIINNQFITCAKVR